VAACRFPDPDCAISLTRPQHDIRHGSRWRQEPLNLLNGNREVCVAKQSELTLGGQHTVLHRPTLASVLKVEYSHVGVVYDCLANQPYSAVGAPIISHHDLPRVILTLKILDHFGEAIGNSGFFVERGNHN
jgi:hypothetical protein